MLNVLSRLPVNSQIALVNGLVATAFLAAVPGAGAFLLRYVDGTSEECSGVLMWRTCTQTSYPLVDRDLWLLIAIGFASLALVCLVLALRLFVMVGNRRRYRAILAGVESMPIQQLADITNSRPSRVRDDIQGMIDSEMITDFYLDRGADQVVSRKYVPKSSYKTVVTCSGCGGNSEVIVGITKSCSYCGQPLALGTS